MKLQLPAKKTNINYLKQLIIAIIGFSTLL